MAHAFPAEELTDAERARRAAEWIETGINDLKRAAELTMGREAEPVVRALLLAATQAAQRVRVDPTLMTPTPKE